MTFDDILTREIYEPPQCLSRHNDMDYRYVDVHRDSVVIAHIALGIMGKGGCLLHCEFERWSLGAFKVFKTAFYSTIVPKLRDIGTKQIVAVHTVDNKWRKFVKMMHFSEPETFLYTRLEL